MEYIPILAMLSGLGAGYIFQKIGKIPVKSFLVIVIISYIPITLDLTKIHPNENVYFNSLIGGLPGAKQKEINSWGNSYGNAYYPAIDWLNKNAENDAKLTIPIGSTSNIPRFKLRSDISLSANYWSGPKNEGEYVLELTYDYPQMQWYSLKYLNTIMKPVFEVKVEDVAIAKLWKNSPEYIRDEYKNQKTISKNINLNSQNNTLLVTLPEKYKIMQVTLRQPTENCRPVQTGYVETSTDGKNWVREVEDIAREQLKHAKLKGVSDTYSFYFVGVAAKYIRFITQNSDACILKSSHPELLTLF